MNLDRRSARTVPPVFFIALTQNSLALAHPISKYRIFNRKFQFIRAFFIKRRRYNLFSRFHIKRSKKIVHRQFTCKLNIKPRAQASKMIGGFVNSLTKPPTLNSSIRSFQKKRNHHETALIKRNEGNGYIGPQSPKKFKERESKMNPADFHEISRIPCFSQTNRKTRYRFIRGFWKLPRRDKIRQSLIEKRIMST